MEKQYIFFNKGKALAIFAVGILIIFVSAVVLLALDAGKYTAGVLLVLIASIVTWVSFKWDSR